MHARTTRIRSLISRSPILITSVPVCRSRESFQQLRTGWDTGKQGFACTRAHVLCQNTKTVFVNNSPGAVQDIQAQLRMALMQGNEVQPLQYKMGP